MIHRKIQFGGGGGGGGVGGSLSVEEIDGTPICTGITHIVFNGVDEVVSCGPPGYVYINATPPPPLLGGPFIMAGSTLYTGRESQSNINYEGAAGDAHNYLTYDGTLTLTEPSFGWASLGVVTLRLNGVIIGEIDLGANWVEGNRAAGQNIAADYNTGSGGFSLVSGICAFQAPYVGMGDFRITSIAPYLGGPIDTDRYQEGMLVVNIIDQNLWRQGYNYVDLQQTGCGGDCPLNETTFKIFHDKDPFGVSDPQVTVPVLAINVPVVKWLSGVQYFGNGSTFNLSVTGHFCFNNVYHVSNAPLTFDDVPTSNWGIANTAILYTHASVAGVSTPPDIGETMTVTNYPITVPPDQDEEDARITVTPRDPYGSYVPQTTISNNYMIMSWGVTSTRTQEHFQDENYRFPLNTNFDVVPAGLVGNWDSTISLAAGTPGYTTSLQVYDPDVPASQNRLHHPDTDYTGRQPVGSPDYTGLAAGVNYQYSRVYQGIIDNSNGIIAVPGLVDADLTSGDITIWIKVPTKTMWLDIWSPYIPATFNVNALYPTGIDGTGCRINAGVHSPNIDGTIEFTLGPYASDLAVNRTLFVLVTYSSNATAELIGNGTGFSLTNW